MNPCRCLWILGVAVLVLLPALWLAGDALHARRTHARSNAPGVRHASTHAFTLNPSGTPALLLIHGFADGPAVFTQMAPLFAEAGFAVRAMNLSGSGIPATDMAGTTLQTWRDDIDREIDDLRAAAPARPLWLVGHSLGGTLAFDAGLRHPREIAGLVLLAPLIEPSNTRSPLLTSNQWFALLNRTLIFSDIVESRLPADLRDPQARSAYQTDQFIHRDIYRALFAALTAIRSRAADWHSPLLMIVSPSDQIVDPGAAAKFFFAATGAAPAKLQEQHAAGHVLPLDAGHDKIAEKIVRFVREAAPP